MNKRIISLALAAILTITVILTAAVSAIELPIIPMTDPAGPGDADGDGKINASDVMAIMKFIVGKRSGAFYKQYADYDGDGNINSKDVLKLMLDISNGDVGA